MKKLRILALVVAVMFLMSGCSFRLASSVDDLISPVSPFGENMDVSYALDSFVNGGYTLKTPVNGKYRSSFVIYDVDGDGNEESIAFYEPSKNLGTIHMAILRRDSDKNWSVAQDVEGNGSDISEISFCDVTGNGKENIIVSWEVISNKSNHIMTVYELDEKDGKLGLSVIADDILFSYFINADFMGDGTEELLLLNLKTGESSDSKAVLYTLKNSKMKELGQTKLDGNVIAYKNIRAVVEDSQTRIYADGIKNNGSSMITELIFWSDYYDNIISPFYSYSTGVTADTYRTTLVTSRDINGDSRVDIPLDSQIENCPDSISAVNWKSYKNTVLVHSCYSLVNEQDGYILVLPDKQFENIFAEYDEKNSVLSVGNKENNKKSFEIKVVQKSVYAENEEKYSKYVKAFENGAKVCLVKATGESEENMSAKMIADSVTAI